MPISTSANRRSAVTEVAGSRAQPLDQQEVRPAEPEQHQEHGDLRADHHAIGGAVEPLPVADVEHAHARCR